MYTHIQDFGKHVTIRIHCFEHQHTDSRMYFGKRVIFAYLHAACTFCTHVCVPSKHINEFVHTYKLLGKNNRMCVCIYLHTYVLNTQYRSSPHHVIPDLHTCITHMYLHVSLTCIYMYRSHVSTCVRTVAPQRALERCLQHFSPLEV